MNKEQIIKSIINRLSDPCISDDEEEIASYNLMDAETAKAQIEIMRRDDKLIGESDYKLPDETTPELFTEAFNCRIQMARHNYKKESFKEWLQFAEVWDVYKDYCEDMEIDMKVVPIEFLDETDEFPFEPVSPLTIIKIAKASNDFNPNHQYCWFDSDKMILHSTDTPFEDGIIDADSVAEWLINNPEEMDMVSYEHADTIPNCWPWEEN